MLYVFNRNEELTAILEQGNKDACPYYGAEIKSVLNGEQILTFRAPYDNEQAKSIEEHGFVAVKNKNNHWLLFLITELVEVHGESLEIEVTAENSFVELDGVIIENEHIDRKNAFNALQAILLGTRWQIGNVQGTEIHDLTIKHKSVLYALQKMRERWNGEITFRIEIAGQKIARRFIDFTEKKGEWKGKRFEYNKDMVEITRTVDAKEVKTALYGLGNDVKDDTDTTTTTDDEEKNKISFADIVWSKANGDPTDKPKGQKWIGDNEARNIWGKDLRGTGSKQHIFGVVSISTDDPIELINETWAQLQERKKPLITYQAKVVDFYRLFGIESENVNLGDLCALIDKDLALQLQARVIEYKENLDNPEEDEMTLGNFLPTFTGESMQEQLNDISRQIGTLTGGNYLEAGDPIDPSWLTTEFEFAKDAIRAGNGTVIMNEGDGILIVDDPQNPQRALKLQAGQLSLANSRDLTTNEFNWRNFGTGEGWLADLVETGHIRFDSAKGGTIQLGGAVIGTTEDGMPIYENGSLVVYGSTIEADGRPIVVSLNGDQGGFDRLSIGELTNQNGSNIVTHSNENFRPQNRVGSDIHFYVDPLDGDDSNEGTADAPKATIQACIDLLPKHLTIDTRIFVMPTLITDRIIDLRGFTGDAWLKIDVWDVGKRVRYVRDWARGSTANPSSHWVEIQGGRGTGSVVHANGNTYPERIKYFNGDTWEEVTATNGQRASDGEINVSRYSDLRIDNAPHVCQVYFGGLYDLMTINVYHYWGDGRTYYDTKTQISENGSKWYTIFDSKKQGEYKETADGKSHDLTKFYMNGKILVDCCMINVGINNVFCNGEEVNGSVLDLHHTNFFEMRYGVLFGNSAQPYAVYANGSNARIIDTEINFAQTAGIISAYGARVENANTRGSGFPYGLYAHTSGIIAGSGTAPWGSTGHTRSSGGGQLFASFTPTVGQYYKPPIIQKTTQWTANMTKSLFGTNWGLTNNIYQGKRPTEATPWYGVMFFNTANFHELQGRPIRSVRLLVQRTNNTGENTSRKPKVYYNMQTSASGSMQTLQGGYWSNVGFTWGQQKWINLPIAVGEAFRDGRAKSLVFWVGSDTANYAKFEPKATLEITHG